MRHWSQILLSILGGLAVIYCVAAQVFVVTNPDLRLRAMLVDPDAEDRGVILQAAPTADSWVGVNPPPEPGDLLFRVHESPVRNFAEFARAQVKLRGTRLVPGGKLFPGSDPDELPPDAERTLIEIEDGKRYTQVFFFRQSEETGQWEHEASKSWIRLQSMPTTGFVLTLVWLVPQLLLFTIGAMAYWSHPQDRPARLFFVLSFLTLVAFVGGSHWWVVAGSLWLTLPFAVSAVLLPAVLLHLFLVYPHPKSFVLLWPKWTWVGLYLIPSSLALFLSVEIVSAAVLSEASKNIGPFATAWGAELGVLTNDILNAARMTISLSVLVAGLYFILSLVSLTHSYRRSRSPQEERQLRWVLVAGLVAAGFVGYSLYLALFQRVELALGAVQLPMFLASACFMFAFAVGMLGPRLPVLGDAVSRGMVYYVVSGGLGIAYALLIAGGSVLALRGELALLDQAVAATLVLMLTIVVLSWLRDRVQRFIDRRFFREKYQLDKALDRMNQAVTGLWDRETLADQMLDSCCDVLRVSRAACYFRTPKAADFERVSVRGTPEFEDRIPASPLLLRSLRDGQSLQRVRAGGSPSQDLLRSLNAELIHGLTVDGELIGLIVLGKKPSAAAFTSEDGTFLTAFERVAGFAMHFAKVHDDFGRLSGELQRKLEFIDEQERQIELLERQLRFRSQNADGDAPGSFQASEIIGRSPAVQQVLQTVSKVATSDSTVLIRGESGTGKELLARAIHENSSRSDGPMVTVHCAALSPTLLESELFGHVRGAFTDAREDKIGRFQLADGGTLFLDEIGDISADVQVKLLRVLQQREFEPVGSHKTVRVDVRVVTATHRNLEELIAIGRFREDLYYRLNVISVTLPPLRERRDDVLDLALHFLAKANQRTGKSVTQIDEAAHRQLMQYEWPGNVRELENVIERAVVLAEGHRISPADLPQGLDGSRLFAPRFVDTKPVISSRTPGRLDDWTPGEVSRRTSGTAEERQQLVLALKHADGNKARAARLLGLPRSTFCSKLKKHALD